MKIKESSSAYITSVLQGVGFPFSVQPIGFAPLTPELLSEIVEKIVQGVHPEKIILFGSYAYGTPTPDSDLDLLVIMQSKIQSARRVLLVTRHLHPRVFPMDILVRTPQEVEDAIQQGNRFIIEILSQGKTLYEHK